jgi:hypothetical protein
MGGPEAFRPPSIAVGGLQALLATVAVLVSQLDMILLTGRLMVRPAAASTPWQR